MRDNFATIGQEAIVGFRVVTETFSISNASAMRVIVTMITHKFCACFGTEGTDTHSVDMSMTVRRWRCFGTKEFSFVTLAADIQLCFHVE